MLSDLFDEMNEEELKAYFKESAETNFRPIIEQYEKEETYKDVYLNKYEVYKLIKDLADSSEPMVSAPTYDYYEINASILLESIGDMSGTTRKYEKSDIEQALDDLKNGNVNTFDSVEDLMK